MSHPPDFTGRLRRAGGSEFRTMVTLRRSAVRTTVFSLVVLLTFRSSIHNLLTLSNGGLSSLLSSEGRAANGNSAASAAAGAHVPYSIRAWEELRRKEEDGDGSFASTRAREDEGRSSDVGNGTALDVTLTFATRRSDRMGSRLQLPFAAWLVARFKGWKFCSPPDFIAEALSFPMCPGDLRNRGIKEITFVDSDKVKESGIYIIPQKSITNWNVIGNEERSNNSYFVNGAEEEWRRMILTTEIGPAMEEELWLSDETVRIAAHVRRGDIYPGKRNDVWIGDDKTIACIEMAKYYARLKRGDGVKTEVHLFSESYGKVNWTRYDGLVDEFHLAPRSDGSDWQLNLRDWRHFILADIFVVGGTFSRLPAYARPPGPGPDGFPLTISWLHGGMLSRNEWVHWQNVKPWNAVAANFPEMTITARLGEGRTPTPENVTIDANAMVEGLCPACKASSVPGAYTCENRIRQYAGHVGTNRDAFLEVQRKVGQKAQCAACDPERCRMRVAKRGPILPIESVIGILYENTCPPSHGCSREDEYNYL